MEKIKNYFRAWDLGRIIRLVIGISLGIGYFAAGEQIYLLGGIFFAAQAVFNMGCPGGACATPAKKDDRKTVMKFEKYEPNKQKTNV